MDPESKQNIETLKSFLKDKRPILFLGAGFSNADAIGYPSYEKLFEKMNLCIKGKLDEDTGLGQNGKVGFRFDELKRICREKGNEACFHECLKEIFSTVSPTSYAVSNHLKLLSLGFAGIITTNYDDSARKTVDLVQEAASIDLEGNPTDLSTPSLCGVLNLTHPEGLVGNFHTYLQSLSRPSGRFSAVLHLHGHVDQMEKVILSEGDVRSYYRGANGEDGFPKRILHAILLMHPIVFFGYSVNDEIIQDLLGQANADLKRREEDKNTWFIIARGADENRRAQFKDLHLSPIFVENFDSDLASVLDELTSSTPQPIIATDGHEVVEPFATPEAIQRDIENMDNFTDSMLNL